MERKLASIKRIHKLGAIEGADRIELAHVGGWKVVVGKDVGHQVGDSVVYCEVDSFLPIEPQFEFLRKTSYKKMRDLEGFRLKTIKMRNQISQGLILPIREMMPILIKNSKSFFAIEIGRDVTEELGIVKYEPPIPAELGGTMKGGFPSFIRKTDEERVQNLAKEYNEWKQDGVKFYITEKLDGSSATFYTKDGEFGVCSRNIELQDPGEFKGGVVMCSDGIERPIKENTFWKVAKELNIKEKLLTLQDDYCIQGELIGEGIQGNPYNIKGHTVRFFNAFNITYKIPIDFTNMIRLFEDLELETVPILDTGYILPDFENILTEAEGLTCIKVYDNRNKPAEREGIVLRSMDSKISFKVISNKFLLKEK